MSDRHYSVWLIWPELPILPKLFLLALSVVSIYSLFSATLIVVRLRSLTPKRLAEDAYSFHNSLSALRIRSARMRQLLGATFYLFGLVFFLALHVAPFYIDLSGTPPWIVILRNFLVDFAFAANVFLVLLVLHLVQWFVSLRVHKCVLLLTAPTSD
jgi:hypothetical protein